jgi:hypothetical protein
MFASECSEFAIGKPLERGGPVPMERLLRKLAVTLELEPFPPATGKSFYVY